LKAINWMNAVRLVRTLLILTVVGPVSIGCGGGGGGAAAKPVSATLDDATITTRVKTAILNDPGVAGQQIDVNASAGVVTLTGVVKTKEEEARAIELAKAVRGVTDVKSTLQVPP
jgi:hyperosmotically inducible periplasmic protein